ncbi:MAG: TM0106 family RecB-like putative nuclease [Patescibacteria group bacterium]
MSENKLTGEHFYKFFQCPHWIWYDIYADAKNKRRVPPILELLYKSKLTHSAESIQRFKEFEQIKREQFKDIEEAFLATLELMKKGKNIYHGVLMHENWSGMPDLLEARPGKSKFGDWHYVVYDIQNTLDLRDENKFQLVFYSLILERLQGVRPQESFVIDPDGNTRSFLVNDFMDQFHLAKEKIEKILEGEKPAPFLKSGCKKTPWYSLCFEDAKECNDISLIFRISQADQRRLYDIGIKTVSQLAEADMNELQAKLEDWPFDKIVRFNNQANVLISNEPLMLKKSNFPHVRHEIYFDIESDPTKDIHYLFGLLIKDNESGSIEYKKFFADNKEEEPLIWKQFLDFIVGLEDFIIYHYAYLEKQVFRAFALKYGAPSGLVSKFEENAIDLYDQTVESVVLPLYFYSLKDVAGYIGYKWDDPKAGGAESVVWYNEWLETKDDNILKKLLKYNEDDVRATLAVKEWLDKQGPSKKKEKLE